MSGFGIFGNAKRWKENQPAPIVEYVGDVRVIREDKFRAGDKGANGSKARAIWTIAKEAKEAGLPAFCSAGGKHSTQALMCCRVAEALDFPFAYHCPWGDSSILEEIRSAGFKVIQHRPGYFNVCNARAKTWAEETGGLYIPTGVEGPRMLSVISAAARQVNWKDCKRLILPAGSGMTCCGILWALSELDEQPQVLAVQVGASPAKRIAKWAPPDWQSFCKIIQAPLRFEDSGSPEFRGIACDPYYSGKCIPYLQEEDFFWNSGARQIAFGRVP